jgi:UDPglucose 6-dehydrogenase
LATVLTLSQRHVTDGSIVAAWVANSQHRKDWAWRVLNKLVLSRHPQAKIAVLGLAYKEDTHSTKNSPSLALLTHIADRSVVIYDPVVSVAITGITFTVATSALEAIQDADVVCIMTPWAEFKKLSPPDIVKRMRGRCLIDPYRVINHQAAQSAGLQYVTLGVAPEAV